MSTSNPEAGRPAPEAASENPLPESPERDKERLFQVEYSADSVPGVFHEERDEDSVLGDAERLWWLNAKEEIHTDEPEKDTATIKEAAIIERAAADRLKDLNVYGVMDGIGASSRGSGLIASRLAAAELAANLAALPDEADAEASRAAIESALRSANRAVWEYSRNRTDLTGQAGTTATVIRVVGGPDGRPRLAYGFCGNTRLYRYRPGTDELIEETIDHTLAGMALRHHLDPDRYPAPKPKNPATKTAITRADYEAVNDAGRPGAVGEEYEEMIEANRTFAGREYTIGLAGPGDFKPDTGIIEAEPRDVILIASDGLYRSIGPDKIRGMLRRGLSSPEMLQKVAETGGPGDDATSVVIRLEKKD
jgi:serine/threonine protein phosphatase PrpC